MSDFHFDTRLGRRALSDLTKAALATEATRARAALLGDVARPAGIEIHELLERAHMLEDAAIVSDDASKANI